MDPFTAADRDALVAASRAVAESGLVVGSSGNLGIRSGEHLLITPRGSRLRAIDPEDCVCVALADGAVDPGHARATIPSSETPLHRAVYAAAPDAGALVHTHSQFATTLSALVEELPAVHYVASAFGGPVRVAPYAVYGSQELADGVAAAMEGRSAALMANHGAVVTARTAQAAVAQAQQLEWWASVYWHARVFGTPAILTGAQLDDVADQVAAFAAAAARGPHT